VIVVWIIQSRAVSNAPSYIIMHNSFLLCVLLDDFCSLHPVLLPLTLTVLLPVDFFSEFPSGLIVVKVCRVT
jgi:hypothetical protein